jgi:hypothetical protein
MQLRKINIRLGLELDEVSLWILKETIEKEAKKAVKEGFYPLDVGGELKKAEDLLRKYRSTKSWERGYGGRAENYDLGFDLDREVLLLNARESLLRAKGAIINLKLPPWTKNLRYYYTDALWGRESVEEMDLRRGVVFMSGNDWALKGFPETQPLWYRCNCRPTLDGIKMIEKFHSEGKRVGTYMSGGMMAITYALLPDSEEDWIDDFMKEYAGHYWHGKRERFWGARGSSSEWRDKIVPYMDFSRFMISQLEFAHRVGFDFVHLDEAFGRYPEAGDLSEQFPNFVVCPNNLARMYIDEENWRFGWTSMGESLGHPSDWDNFHRRMRQRSLRARNITWWGWHTYTPFDAQYQNISYATTLANKGTDVSHSNPSDNYVDFSFKFSDYIYGSYVDVYVPQEIVRAENPPEHLRTIVNRRVLVGGKEELIVHVLNIKPDSPPLINVKLEVDAANFNVRWPPKVTFATPENGAKILESETDGRKVKFNVPEVKTWGIIIIGETVFPRVELRLVSRGKIPIENPLDNGFVPGEEIDIEAKVEEIIPVEYVLDLHLPEGWKYKEISRAKNLYLFRVMPTFAERGRRYAITPLIKKDGEAMPSWPLILQAKDKIEFRIIPPLSESPSRGCIYELEIKNYSGNEGNVKVAIEAPPGWKIEKTEFEVYMGAGEEKRISLLMTPPDYHIRFWDQIDVSIPIRWSFHEFTGSSNLQIRVFPARFYVYSKGVEKMIMHSYPNLYFVDDLEEAKKLLKNGEYVAFWFVNQNPEENRPIIDEIVSMGGGVLWMGEPFSGENCPVSLLEGGLQSKTIRYLSIPKEEKEYEILAPALRKRMVYESETGFKVFKVKPKDWGKVIAVWGGMPEGKDDLRGSPAAVISRDPRRRIVYIGSDLETTSEEFYRFEDRHHHESHWYQTYIFYNLLSWASGAFTPKSCGN